MTLNRPAAPGQEDAPPPGVTHEIYGPSTNTRQSHSALLVGTPNDPTALLLALQAASPTLNANVFAQHDANPLLNDATAQMVMALRSRTQAEVSMPLPVALAHSEFVDSIANTPLRKQASDLFGAVIPPSTNPLFAADTDQTTQQRRAESQRNAQIHPEAATARIGLNLRNIPSENTSLTAERARVLPTNNTPAASSARPSSNDRGTLATAPALATPAAHATLSASSAALPGANRMLSVDPLNSALRITPLQTEFHPVRVAEQVARDFGLRDGQVIQGVVEDAGDTLRLVVNGQALQLPLSESKLAAGDARAWRVTSNGQGTFLSAVNPSVNGASTLGEAATRAEAATANAPAANMMALLLRSETAPGLGAALSSPALLRALAMANAPELSALLGASARPNLSRLSAAEIREGFLNSGLFGEALMARGMAVSERDIKIALRRLMKALPAGAQMLESLGEAVDEIEANQLKAVHAQAQGEIFWQFTLPFADHNPVRFTFQRAAPTREQPRPPFVVNVYTESPALGEVWLKSSIDAERKVALTMWARRDQIAKAAGAGEKQLARALEKAGLTMTAFQVYNAARPRGDAANAEPGAILNVEA